MKLSWNWLSDFVDLSALKPEDVVSRLTMAVCEVEEIEHTFAHLDTVIVGKILERKKHPGADRLSVCTVNIGKQNLEIVCGAPNAEPGMLVPVALVGSKLPGKDGAVLEIKKAAIRGVESSGMLCSSQEIGLDLLFGSTDGLFDLNNVAALSGKLKPGQKITAGIPVSDIVLDIDNKSITHRPDLWCHFGFAREIAALYKKKLLKDPLVVPAPRADKTVRGRKILIDRGGAHAYFGLACENARVTDTPIWMKARLASVGQKSINNIVDASNYLLLEIGQPNHAFDAAKLRGDTIHVSLAHKGAKIDLLDGETREIPEGSIVIRDGKDGTACALAGIMGGLQSAISPETKSLFLESATFPREKIRRTLSRVQLRTDSAVRFEKGQDPAKAKPALFRLVQLLKETCPDIRVGAVTGSAPVPPKKNKITITLSLLRSRLGFPIDAKLVEDILGRLHFIVKKTPKPGKETAFTITAPTFRSQYDVTIPEDIVEELGRIYGYDNISPQAPASPVESVEPNRERAFEHTSRGFFVDTGFTETSNYSFCSEADNLINGSTGLRIKNQMAPDKTHLRVSLVPGILRQAALNQDRFDLVRLVEFGRVYIKDTKGSEIAREEKRIALVEIPPETAVSQSERTLDAFLEFRGRIEDYCREFLPSGIRLKLPSKPSPFFHPGCHVEVQEPGGESIGSAGLVHPNVAAALDLRRTAFAADLDFNALAGLAEEKRKTPVYSPPSALPDSYFELSVVMDAGTSTAAPVDTVASLAISEIAEVSFIGAYSGGDLEKDKKISASYKFRLADPNATLSGDRVAKIRDSVISALGRKGFPLR